MARESVPNDVATQPRSAGRDFVLEDSLAALGIAADHAPVVAAAVDHLVRAGAHTEVEAFVRLRWHSRCERQSVSDAAAAILGSCT